MQGAYGDGHEGIGVQVAIGCIWGTCKVHRECMRGANMQVVSINV